MQLVTRGIGLRVGSVLFLLAVSPSSFADFTSAVTAVHSGRCMTVQNNSTGSGANVLQYQCDGRQSQFIEFKQESGDSSIYSLIFKHSGKCLDVSSGASHDGANLQQWSCNNSSSQRFSLVPRGGDQYSLRSEVSGKMVDVSGSSGSNNANIHQWTEHGRDNQTWTINASVQADNAGVTGSWGSVIEWPEIAISAANLPDGRILTWSSTETNSFPANREFSHASVFDPHTGGFQTVDNNFHDMFCAGVSMLEDGRVLASGGNPDDNRTSSFSPVTMDWTNLAPMNDRRWYASNLTLPDNKVFSTFGKSSGNRSERYDPFLNTWTRTNGANLQTLVNEQNSSNSLSTVNSASNMQWWGQMALAPNGSVFHGGPTPTWHLFDPNGNGATESLGKLAGDRVRVWGNIVSYDVGKVMLLGGADRTKNPATVTNNVYLVDLNDSTPQVTQGPSTRYSRANSNSIVLPNGEVIVVGGNTTGQLFNDAGSILAAEIWNPESNTWRTAASMSVPRNYHSTALLMKDGRVLSMGGGACGNCSANHLDGQIFSPPYLFDSNGNEKTRPILNGVPTTAKAGDSITIAASSSASKFSMIRLSATSHAMNTDQRFIPVPSVSNNDGTFTLSLNENSNVVIPGYYWLFAVDAEGTPSVGQNVRVVREQGGTTTGNMGYEYYEGTWNNLPNFDTLVPVLTGQLANFSLSPKSRGDHYGFRFTTTIDTNAGAHTFYTASDDGSHLYIDGQLVVNNDGLHGVQERQGVINLAAGEHELVVTFFEKTGGDSLSVSWRGPGFSKRVMAPDDFVVPAAGGGGGDGEITPVEAPSHSSTLIVESSTGNDRVWNVNPDNNSVSVSRLDGSLITEISVGEAPWNLAKAPLQNRIYVTNKDSATISVIDTTTLQVTATLDLPHGSRPHGIVFAKGSNVFYVVLEASAEVRKFTALNNAQLAVLPLGDRPRHLSVSDNGQTLYITTFITPPLPGESTANVDVLNGGGELKIVNAASMTLSDVITLGYSTRSISESAGPGIPNYLSAPVISNDEAYVYIPSKQDNILAGGLRGQPGMTFDQTVRAVTSRVNLASGLDEPGFRIDHDNASVATGAAFSGDGRYLFIALETSRELVVYDVENGFELERLPTGRAPQGVALSSDGSEVFVHNFMDRSVTKFDLTEMFEQHLPGLVAAQTTPVVSTESMSGNLFLGKQLFYDAADDRLARDNYMSCASCHNEGDGDGRVWDMTGMGEGLRETIVLTGKGPEHGMLHWSSNFDEVQDFENQIRSLGGGTGLLSAADFAATQDSLGTPKAGRSAELDALAAYVDSLNENQQSPHRSEELSTVAAQGAQLLADNDCLSCHAGDVLTDSTTEAVHDVGTINAASGTRRGEALEGIDTPTLFGLWQSAPYLHNGSVSTIADAINAHGSVTLNANEREQIQAFLLEIESIADIPEPTVVVPPPQGNVYAIAAAHSNKLLDVGAASTASGGDVIQWSDYGGNNQRWSIEENGEHYVIKAVHSGFCLALEEAWVNNIAQETCNDSLRQRWSLVSDNGGYSLESPFSGECIHVFEGQVEDGAWVIARDCDGTEHQRFIIDGFAGGQEPPPSSSITISNLNSSLNLSIPGGASSGGEATQNTVANVDTQKWVKEAVGSNWRLKSVHSGQCLSLNHATQEPGVGVIQDTCSSDDIQLWQEVGSGTVEWRNVHNGQCLAIGEGSMTSGANAITWTCGGYSDQQWVLN